MKSRTQYDRTGGPVISVRVKADGRPLPLYLTMIMDLYDRKVIGWALSTSMKAVEATIQIGRQPLKTGLTNGH